MSPVNRDDRNGRFTYGGDMSRLCICGHKLGDHFGAAPHECAISTWAPYTPCDCQKFRPSRKSLASRIEGAP